MPFAEAAGRRWGELYAALAEPCNDPAFRPERVGAEETRNWAEMTVAEVERAYGVLAESELPGDVVIDFEGEPAERRQKGSAFVDVAGMLRSFAYAAGSVARELLPAAHTRERHVALLDRFVKSASTAFLDAYYAAAAAAPHRWFDDREASARLIDLFPVCKVTYGISYEAANRSDRLDIPLNDFVIIAERLLASPPEAANA